MSYLSLSFTLAFVAIAAGLSLWLKLSAERDILVAAVRATIQLLIVGYILKLVFASNNAGFILAFVALMVFVAAWNARQRAKHIPGIIWPIIAGLAVTEVTTQGLLLILGVVPFAPRYVIPISGMIVGNAMVASGLLLNRIQREVANGRNEINTILALGGTAKQAIYPHLKQAIRAGLIPTVDSIKTTGLVQLPGMMTGLIIAGADPVQAVRYQLMILFCILAGAAMTTMVVAFMTYPKLFTPYLQLRNYESLTRK